MAKRTTSRSPSQADDAAPSAPAPRRSRRSRADATGDVASPESMTAAGEGADDAGEHMPSENDIRLRAYHRYLERGGGHGMDFQDWLEAERELRSKK